MALGAIGMMTAEQFESFESRVLFGKDLSDTTPCSLEDCAEEDEKDRREGAKETDLEGFVVPDTVIEGTDGKTYDPVEFEAKQRKEERKQEREERKRKRKTVDADVVEAEEKALTSLREQSTTASNKRIKSTDVNEDDLSSSSSENSEEESEEEFFDEGEGDDDDKDEDMKKENEKKEEKTTEKESAPVSMEEVSTDDTEKKGEEEEHKVAEPEPERQDEPTDHNDESMAIAADDDDVEFATE